MMSNTLPNTGNEIALQYVNAPMEYTANYNSCKNESFQMQKFDIFLIFALHSIWKYFSKRSVVRETAFKIILISLLQNS